MIKKKQKIKTFFTQGQYIVYPIHGVGKFKTIVTKNICNQDIELAEFVFGSTSFFVPVINCQEFGIRELETPEMITKALKMMSIPQISSNQQGNLSKKMTECSARINSGSIIDLAIAIRETRVSQNNQNNISFTQRTLHNDAIEKLANEMVIVLKCDITQAYSMINEALMKNHKQKIKIELSDDFEDEVKNKNIQENYDEDVLLSDKKIA